MSVGDIYLAHREGDEGDVRGRRSRSLLGGGGAGAGPCGISRIGESKREKRGRPRPGTQCGGVKSAQKFALEKLSLRPT